MKVSIEAKELLPILERAGRVAPKEQPDRPILTNLALRTLKNSILEIRAANGSIYYEARVVTNPSQNGQAAVKAEDFIKYVSLSPHSDFEFELKDGWLQTAYGSVIDGEFSSDTKGVRYSTMEWATFPNPMAGTVGNKFFVRAKDFREMVDQVKFAVAREETGTPAASCLTMRCTPTGVELAAHNRVCIAVGSVDYSQEPENRNDQQLFMIPGTSVSQLVSLLPRDETELSIAASSTGGHLVISWNGNERLTVSVYDVQPISLSMLSKFGPDQCDYQANLKVDGLKKAIARLASPDNVSFAVQSVAENVLYATFYSATEGFEGESEIHGELNKSTGNLPPEGIQIGLNVRALGQMLDSTDSAFIMLSFSGPKTPIIVQGIEERMERVKTNFTVYMLPVITKKRQADEKVAA